MGTSLLVSEQEYLTTSYEPECEYDEGKLIERNTGELPHSILMGACATFCTSGGNSMGYRFS
jgi:hypothetical protein